jgi:hypothetical protein
MRSVVRKGELPFLIGVSILKVSWAIPHCRCQLCRNVKGRMNILIHRLAICKCSENVVVCIDIHCGCLRQDGIIFEGGEAQVAID